ncbi:RodZ domain-containing protein [Neptunicella sp. SCSIO 80796]|uniref:RodZ domain-containing protein n=1 Tax=Neptunicella plasticusilytica TaxID=3117012 RepID=UPI003A4E1502
MSEEQQIEQPAIQGPGQALKAARKAMQLTTEQVAQRLNLREHIIEDLENDNYNTTISLTFTKGYLKSYAKLVKVPEQQILEAFEQVNRASKEPAKLQSFSRRVARQASDDRLMLVTYAILAILIALSLMWWLQQSDDESSAERTYPNTQTEKNLQKEAALEESQVEQPVLNEAEPPPANENTTDEDLEQDSQAADSETLNNTTVESTEPATQDDVAPLQEVIQQQQTDSPDNESEQQLAAPVELVFEFSEDCWINIIDATGEAIAYGIKVDGRVMPVSGVPPFQVTVAVPESVKISYAGEQIDMSRFPVGRTARFTLPLQD